MCFFIGGALRKTDASSKVVQNGFLFKNVKQNVVIPSEVVAKSYDVVQVVGGHFPKKHVFLLGGTRGTEGKPNCQERVRYHM